MEDAETLEIKLDDACDEIRAVCGASTVQSDVHGDATGAGHVETSAGTTKLCVRACVRVCACMYTYVYSFSDVDARREVEPSVSERMCIHTSESLCVGSFVHLLFDSHRWEQSCASWLCVCMCVVHYERDWMSGWM